MILFVIAPGRPPLYITYSSPSSSSLLVEWGAIPPQFKNGIIRGFEVHVQYNGTVKITVRGPRLYWVILDGLKKFTVYHIRVFAFTNEGYGPENNITAVTAQDGMEPTYNICFLENKRTNKQKTKTNKKKTRDGGKRVETIVSIAL